MTLHRFTPNNLFNFSRQLSMQSASVERRFFNCKFTDLACSRYMFMFMFIHLPWRDSETFISFTAFELVIIVNNCKYHYDRSINYFQ